jgi:hypothetical protein
MNPISSYCCTPQNHVLERKQKRERVLKSEETVAAANGTYNPRTVFMQIAVLNWHITPPHAPSSWQGSVPVVQPGKLVAISGVLAFVHTAKSSWSADTTKQNKTHKEKIK